MTREINIEDLGDQEKIDILGKTDDVDLQEIILKSLINSDLDIRLLAYAAYATSPVMETVRYNDPYGTFPVESTFNGFYDVIGEVTVETLKEDPDLVDRLIDIHKGLLYAHIRIMNISPTQGRVSRGQIPESIGDYPRIQHERMDLLLKAARQLSFVIQQDKNNINYNEEVQIAFENTLPAWAKLR